LDDPAELAQLAELKIPVLHLVGVDMYPLEEEIAKPDATAASVRAQTDIGGPTMLRAGAKGRRIVLSVAEQRQQVLEWLQAGKPDEQAFLEQLAARAEYEAARYIGISAQYLGGDDVLLSAGRRVAPTKYGENPQQKPAGLYADNRVGVDLLGIDQFTHVKGWELSFVNETDMDRLVQTVTHVAAGFERNFGEVPAVAIGVKHGNACGAGVAETLADATRKMLEGDEVAIFGGSVMLTGEIDEEIATILMRHNIDEGSPNRMLDSVIAASATPEAVEILSRAKLRVVVNPALQSLGEQSLDTTKRVRPVRGGQLQQPNYDFVQDLGAEHMEHHGTASEQQQRDMVLAWAVGATSNSNTITIVKDGKLLGNGVGQQDRVGAAKLALSRAHDRGHDVHGAVVYSDSFFPFPDGPQLLVDAGISAVLTSSGSVKDALVVETFQAGGVVVSMVPDTVGRGFYAH
jgi:phosphoribosylaminoimidazolecarboxamide formyltransferase/IMP cyclohydrolase